MKRGILSAEGKLGILIPLLPAIASSLIAGVEAMETLQ